MSTTEVAAYRMNPAEDVILFGDQITEGMWVLAEAWIMRTPHGYSEDERMRAQRFRRVTRLQPRNDPIVRFIGEWVDGYQEVHTYNVAYAWLVKRDSMPAGDPS